MKLPAWLDVLTGPPREAGTFVVIVPHYFGKGATLADAVAACRRVGGSVREKEPGAVLWTKSPPESVTVDGMGRVSSPVEIETLRRHRI
jgi:hypothetical protein